MDQQAIAQKVFGQAGADLVELWLELDAQMLALKLRWDVKTIYISYTDEKGFVVAAVYPDRRNHRLEVALSLPPEHESGDLHDASHLKWRTMPWATYVDESSDLDRLREELLVPAAKYAPASIPMPTEVFRDKTRWT